MAEDGDDPVGRAMMIAGASRLPEEPTTANVLDQMPKWGGLKSYLPDSVRDALATAADYRDRALSAIPPAAMLAANFVSPGVRAPVRVANPIKAYHGSPHDFDAFDLSKIGTGEGAQAYGHGLYFAENPSVAKTYRAPHIDVKTVPKVGEQPVGPGVTGNDWLDAELASGVYRNADHVRSVLANRRLRGDINGGFLENPLSAQEIAALHPSAQSALRRLDELESSGQLTFPPPGRMYEVALHASPEQFLDWDKPLSKQSDLVRQAIRQFDNADRPPPKDINELRRRWKGIDTRDPDPTGSAKYRSIAQGNGDEAASRALGEAGIHGISYADQLSRGMRIGPSTPANDIAREWLQGHGGDAQKAIADLEDFLRSRKQDPATNDVLNALKNWRGPTNNYVVWSPEIIEILRKYGILGPAALAAMGSLTNKQTEE